MTKPTFTSTTVDYLNTVSGFKNFLKGIEYGTIWTNIISPDLELPCLDEVAAVTKVGKSLVAIPESAKKTYTLVTHLFEEGSVSTIATTAFADLLDVIHPLIDVVELLNNCKIIEVVPTTMKNLNIIGGLGLTIGTGLATIAMLGKLAQDDRQIAKLEDQLITDGMSDDLSAQIQASYIRKGHDQHDLGIAASYLALGVLKSYKTFSASAVVAPWLIMLTVTSALAFTVMKHYYDVRTDYKNLPPLSPAEETIELDTTKRG